VIICIFASVNNAAMNICNRRLQGTHFSVVMFFHGALGFTVPLVITLIYCACTDLTMFQYAAAGWLWICMGGLSDLLACSFNVIAFQNDESAFISVLNYSQVFYAFILDIFVFEESINGL